MNNPLVTITQATGDELLTFDDSVCHTMQLRDPKDDTERQYLSTVKRIEDQVYNPYRDKNIDSLAHKARIVVAVMLGFAVLDAVLCVVMFASLHF